MTGPLDDLPLRRGRDHLLRRIDEELAAALAAASPVAASIHVRLATAYARRISDEPEAA